VSAALITLITAPHCELCQHAKEVLARVGADYDIEVSVLSDETEQGRALMMEHLVAFPPGVLIEQKLFSCGRLSERKLRRQLERVVPPVPEPVEQHREVKSMHANGHRPGQQQGFRGGHG
jgi:hypothetical protein